MKWEWFFLTYVLWGLIIFWFVLWCVFLISKRKDIYSECSVFVSFFKHWSFIALIVCSIMAFGITVIGRYMVLDLLETKGYHLIIEKEGWIGSSDIEVEYDTYWRDQITVLNSCVNHENKLVFVKLEAKYDVDRPPETLDEIQFLLEDQVWK